MAQSTEKKFGELKMDERYKKLERTLKLASLKKGNMKDLGDSRSWAVPSPSISSINVDAFDSSTTAAYSHTSRRGSEVISSSKNLRNILPKRKEGNVGDKTIATSSIKKYDMKASDGEDHIIMPPPNLHYTCKKRNKMPAFNSGQTSLSIQSTGASVAGGQRLSQNTNIQQPNINVGTEYQKPDVMSHPVLSNFQNGCVKVFSRWRVMLNAEGQLLIKGTIECGKVARSKPVIRRLTATRVESMFKHQYDLDGTIVDERNELPDYVRGKFYNGFPDDWDNVYQIWRTFVQQGCALTFRWPTPITDSDDDLRSEITDITFSRSRNPKSKSISDCYRESTSFECSREVTEEIKGHSPCDTSQINNSCTQTYISGTTGDLYYNMEEDSCNKENSEQLENQAFTPRTNKLKDIMKEDKLRIIINNLVDKNCSQEYIDKIIEMFDCMNYVVSYRSTENISKIKSNESTKPVQKGSNESCNKLNCISESMTYRNIGHTGKREKIFATKNTPDTYEGTACLNKEYGTVCYNLSKQKNLSQVNNDGSDSESETYAGIPKISLERILRQREASMKPYKRKTKKKIVYEQEKSELERHTSIASATCPPNPSLKVNVNLNPNESCISITEDERDFSNSRCTSFSDNHLSRTADTVQAWQRTIRDSTDQQQSKEIRQHRHGDPTPKPIVVNSVSTNLRVSFPNKESKSFPDLLNQSEKTDVNEVNDVHYKSPVQVGNQTDCRQDARVVNVDSTAHLKSTQGSSKNKMEIDSKAKSLTAWIPKVVDYAGSDTEVGLIFEGNLLNEAGHVVQRRFVTDIVHRRVSPRIIETVNNELYRLVGDLNDAKHAIPKQLLNQCRYGCPSRMDNFCRMWKSLRSAESNEKLRNASMDTKNVAISSKGRRILPPLSYWTGERIILKGNNAVYSPGAAQDTLRTISFESPSKRSRSKSATKQGGNVSKQNNEPIDVETPNDSNKASGKLKQSATKHKVRSVQPESDSSSDDKCSPVHKRQRLKANQQDRSSLAEVLQRKFTRSLNAESTGEIPPSRSTAATNPENSIPPAQPSKPMMTDDNSTTERYRDVICTYYRDIPLKDDTLSDDQMSHV